MQAAVGAHLWNFHGIFKDSEQHLNLCVPTMIQAEHTAQWLRLYLHSQLMCSHILYFQCILLFVLCSTMGVPVQVSPTNGFF